MIALPNKKRRILYCHEMCSFNRHCRWRHLISPLPYRLRLDVLEYLTLNLTFYHEYDVEQQRRMEEPSKFINENGVIFDPVRNLFGVFIGDVTRKAFLVFRGLCITRMDSRHIFTDVHSQMVRSLPIRHVRHLGFEGLILPPLMKYVDFDRCPFPRVTSLSLSVHVTGTSQIASLLKFRALRFLRLQLRTNVTFSRGGQAVYPDQELYSEILKLPELQLVELFICSATSPDNPPVVRIWKNPWVLSLAYNVMRVDRDRISIYGVHALRRDDLNVSQAYVQSVVPQISDDALMRLNCVHLFGINVQQNTINLLSQKRWQTVHIAGCLFEGRYLAELLRLTSCERLIWSNNHIADETDEVPQGWPSWTCVQELHIYLIPTCDGKDVFLDGYLYGIGRNLPVCLGPPSIGRDEKLVELLDEEGASFAMELTTEYAKLICKTEHLIETDFGEPFFLEEEVSDPIETTIYKYVLRELVVGKNEKFDE